MTEPSDLTPEQRRDITRSSRKRDVRKSTVNLKRMPLHERRHLALLVPVLTAEEIALRPKTRSDCEEGLRPCPYVGCQHHLFLDVSGNGNLTLNFPDLEPEQLVESCALDVADQGEQTLEFVGELMNITRERVRQVEVRAMWRIERTAPDALRDLAGATGRPRCGTEESNRRPGGYVCGRCGKPGHNARTCTEEVVEE